VADPVAFDAIFLSLDTHRARGPNDPRITSKIVLEPLVSLTDLMALFGLVGGRVEVTLKYMPDPLPNGATVESLRSRLK
jgi:hypothetical protein